MDRFLRLDRLGGEEQERNERDPSLGITRGKINRNTKLFPGLGLVSADLENSSQPLSRLEAVGIGLDGLSGELFGKLEIFAIKRILSRLSYNDAELRFHRKAA